MLTKNIFMLKGFNTRLLIFVLLIFFCFGLADNLFAQSIMESVEEKCRVDGSCELSDLGKLAIGISRWILGIVGSLSLLAFVYGGVLFLISAGNRETVQKAKQVIIGAVIGLTIVFASYLIIQFVLQALGYQETWTTIPT